MLLEWHTGYVPVGEFLRNSHRVSEKRGYDGRPALWGNLGRVDFHRQFFGPIEEFGSPVSYREWAALTIADSSADRAQTFQDRIVQRAVSCEDSAVFCQCAAVCELEWLAVEIGDSPACLFDDDRPGGLVPDSLSIIGPRTRDQSQQDITFAGSKNRVFRLAVHSDRCRRYSELRRKLTNLVYIRVRFFDGAKNACGSRLRTR